MEQTPQMVAGPVPAPDEDELRSRFREEVRRRTHVTAIAGGVVAMIGFPVWSFFDHLVQPAQAWDFTYIRLLATLPIAIFWALLFTEFGRRRPELLMLAIIGIVEVAVGVMVTKLDGGHAAYALGMSLPIYASAFLVVWPLRYTLTLAGLGFGSLTLGWLTFGTTVTSAEVAAVAFYLVTATAIAIVGQVFRDQAAWREFRTLSALEEEQSRSRRLVDKLNRLSHEDSLTGLANRRAWDAALERECARAARNGTTLSVLLVDLDRLKEINDGFGHSMGDVVLQAVSALLRERTRSADLVARIGGDEFGILSVGTDELGAANLGEALRALVDAEQPGGIGLGPVTVSVGVAEWEGVDDTPGTLLMRADRRLYTAKAKRNVVCAGDAAESGRAIDRPAPDPVERT